MPESSRMTSGDIATDFLKQKTRTHFLNPGFFCCPLNEKCSAKNLLDDQEVKQHQQAKDDAIPSEDLEVVFFDILHQEFDNDD